MNMKLMKPIILEFLHGLIELCIIIILYTLINRYKTKYPDRVK